MKKINKFLLILVGVCLILGLSACGNKKNEEQNSVKKFKEKNVTVNYKDTVNLLEYFGKKDSFANAKLYDPEGTQISLRDGSLYTDTMGTYQLMLYGSKLTYNLNVGDIVGPYVMLNEQSKTVYWGDAVVINPSAVDNVDSEFDLDSLEYTVTKRGWDVATNQNSFVADELGEYIIEFDLPDVAGNEAHTYSINCVMPKKIVKPVGTKIKISDDIFVGLIDSEKEYTYEMSITKLTEDGETKVKGNSITIDRSSIYKIRQVATCGEDQIVLEYIYCSDGFAIYDFNDGDINMLSTTSEQYFSAVMSRTEVAENDYAALIKCLGRYGWNTIYISGLEPNTTYDRIAFDVNLLKAPNVPGVLKLSFYNRQGESGHSLFFQEGKNQAVFSNIETNSLGTATVFAYIHETGETEYTIDNLIVQKSTAVNVEKGVYLAFAGGAAKVKEKANTTSGNEGYSILRLEGITSGFNTLKVFATKQAGLKPNTEYKVTIDAKLEGSFPAFFEEHAGGNDFVLGEPGGQIVFMITTDAKGEFEKVWNTVYVNSQMKYAEFYNVEFDKVIKVDSSDTIYGEGIEISASPKGSVFDSVYEMIKEGKYAGKYYKGIRNVTQSGFSNLTISANSKAGLKPNTEYKVMVNVESDFNTFPGYYEEHAGGNDFIICPSGMITFVITTDANGEFIKAWDTVYVSGGAEYLNFTGITIRENKAKASVYGEGISIVPAPTGATFKVTEKEVAEGANAGKVYTSIQNMTTSGWSTLTIDAKSSVGLKPNTTYTVEVDVESDIINFPGFYEEHAGGNDFMICPNGTISFEITTDALGMFTKVWDKVYVSAGGSYIDFVKITITEKKDSVYGNGISVVPTSVSSVAFSVVDKVVAEGENAGKTYVSAVNTSGSGFTTLTVSASSIAGLKTNTEYTVELDVMTDVTNFPGYYEEHAGGNDFIICPSGTIKFTVTTDENGRFTKVWNSVYLSAGGTYIDYTAIRISEVKYGVYGKGISVIPAATGTAFDVISKEMTEGEYAGEQYTSIINMRTSGWSSLTVTASPAAGLKANTEYTVELDVVSDLTSFPGYYEEHAGGNDFIICPSGTIKFKITTDDKGTFTKSWSKVYVSAGGTYIDFTGIRLTEIKASVYGKGISLVPSPIGAAFEVTNKEILSGENAGKVYASIGNITSAGTSSLSISATSLAELKGNTEYLVTVHVELDAIFPGYFEEHTGGNDFILAQPNGDITFTVMTNANGEFTKVWDTIYVNSTGSYVDFIGIDIVEAQDESASVYGDGVTVTPSGSFFTVTEKTVTEGVNKGKTYTGITGITSSGWSSLEIKATNEAGLKANTEYKVALDVALDASFPGYFDERNGNTFIIGAPGGTIVFTTMTDANGEFTKSYNDVIYTAGGQYVDFTGITITENN